MSNADDSIPILDLGPYLARIIHQTA